ncbi:MAG TPA: ATP-binding protein [Candidatus Binatia bacterium]|nr:ATP-binding protein [Candidatus Binatia bacterium]
MNDEASRDRDSDRPAAPPSHVAAESGSPSWRPHLAVPFRVRLTLALVIAAVLPLAAFGGLVFVIGLPSAAEETLGRLLLLALAVTVVLAVLVAFVLAADLGGPLRQIAAAVERASAGDLSTPLEIPGEDEIARLAESHNRLAADLERRNRELARIRAAIEGISIRDGVDFLAGRAAIDAREAFGLLDAAVLLEDPSRIPEEEVVPGLSRPVRAELRIGDERLGVLVGRLPATRRWERADQDLLELFAREIAIAIRNAELFARVEAQNEQLRALDAAKDDFLRGVSHNLQTPLARIRAYADQLDRERADRRLGIIVEQADRLSRMVRQLLTVSRLESGALKPQAEVVALGPRVRRAWEALAAGDIPFRIDDRSDGWLAVADPDQLDQVLWALLDNATKHGRGTPVEVEIARDLEGGRLRLTVADQGPGVAEADRSRLFSRFGRGSGMAEDGSGLGLYVSRELCRAMGGDLVLEPQAPGSQGAAFSVYLPAEAPTES